MSECASEFGIQEIWLFQAWRGGAHPCEWHGKVVPLQELSVESLRDAINSVLNTEQYTIRARELAAAIQRTNGLEKAANLIDHVLRQAVG
jgi:hypothetical protein